MKSSSYSLTEIAYLTGFSDQSHLRHFQKAYRTKSIFVPKDCIKKMRRSIIKAIQSQIPKKVILIQIVSFILFDDFQMS
jgi:AraC-like DNA-binding protein